MVPLSKHIDNILVMASIIFYEFMWLIVCRNIVNITQYNHNFYQRLDGDMYESTVDVLYNLYDKLSIGGYVIMNDVSA